MSTPDQDDASLRGLGAGLMLPAQGNPFAKAPPPPGADLLAVGGERAAPEKVQPEMARPQPAEEVLESLSTTTVAVETTAASVPKEVSMAEPRDLTPEDLMALFPSTHAERETPAADTTPGAPATAPEAEPQPAAIVPAELVTTTTLDTAPAPAPAAPVSATLPVAAPAAEVVPAAASVVLAGTPSVELIPATAPEAPAVLPATEVVVLPATAAPAAAPTVPAGARSAMPTAPPAPSAAPAVLPPRGVRLTGTATQGSGAQMTLNLANDGLQTVTFDPGTSLPANASLTQMFVPDARLMTLWLEIDSVEAGVTAARGMSQNLAGELLDRLMRARNLLMNDRAQYEEAARQVAAVKYHLANFRGTTFLQKPLFISVYLLAFFAAAWVLFYLGLYHTWGQLPLFNIQLDAVWYTMLMGGIGGFTGAAYSLVSHVARDRDYDPQFALWYYLNPWMGLVLGIFVYIAVYILVNVGSLVVNAQATSVTNGSATNGSLTNGSVISKFMTLFFAWMVGFKHNIAFDLADVALKKLVPGDPTSADSGSDNAKPPAAGAKQ